MSQSPQGLEAYYTFKAIQAEHPDDKLAHATALIDLLEEGLLRLREGKIEGWLLASQGLRVVKEWRGLTGSGF